MGPGTVELSNSITITITITITSHTSFMALFATASLNYDALINIPTTDTGLTVSYSRRNQIS
jgi:hypothetical protein